ncbi:glycosyltransferase family 4 protein [Motiliproteus sp. MSK22-1]|uniref:glycosyltransferase family 4 protein n=1 Tax=Motiliproteus sp. MSK22-1 TaxID=1897630 RepID=UPI000978CE59|nr:glycosyltransferase family 4 protein [Motiliproteus sp. MSK22-1]OMH25677.1 glycosyltransferase WbuB [Motiliproteus sp. MSK22-1]
MNILFHHRTRGRGAEGVHIRGVVKGLRELGHRVSILSLPGADPEEETGERAVNADKKKAETDSASGKSSTSTVRWLTDLTRHVPEFAFELFELAYNLVAWFRIRKAVASTDTTLIYERYSLFMFITVWWGKRKGIPVILEVNDSALVHRVRPLSFRAIAIRIERWIFTNATGLVFISTHFREVAQQGHGTIAPCVVSPNAADLDKFVIDEQAAKALRVQLGIDDKVVLGYVGAFVHWHGIDWFVDLIADRLKEYPNLVLLLVGDGVCFNSIRERVAEAGAESQIILPGRVEHSEVATYLSAMDFGILPDSNDYGSPMKLFEFMAMAKGMVVPDFSPISEVVKDNCTSWLFKANDREGCVERVLQLVGDSSQQIEVGNNARAYIERERQWRHNAEQILTMVPNETS